MTLKLYLGLVQVRPELYVMLQRTVSLKNQYFGVFALTQTDFLG